MTGLDWLVENDRAVRSMLAHVVSRVHARERRQMISDLYAECVDRAPRIANLWSPLHVSGASLTTYMLSNLRWYAWKRLKKISLERARSERGVYDSDREALSHRPGSRFAVIDILDLVDGVGRLLMYMKVEMHMTIRDIAVHLGEPRSTVQVICARTMEELRGKLS